MIIEIDLKRMREFKGISQKYMASRLNISQPSYSEIERNISRTGLENYKIIADEFGISLEDAFNHKIKLFVYVFNNTYPAIERDNIEKALIILTEQNVVISKIHKNLLKMNKYKL